MNYRTTSRALTFPVLILHSALCVAAGAAGKPLIQRRDLVETKNGILIYDRVPQFPFLKYGPAEP